MKKTGQKQAVIFLVSLLTMMAAVSFAGPPEYKGYNKCNGCHGKEVESWKGGMMNKNAFEALLPGERADSKVDAGLDPDKDYTIEPECLSCHATGYGKPGGFVSNIKTPGLAGVTCEACHGPGGEYWRVMAKKRKTYSLTDLVNKGYFPAEQAICDQCHTPGCPIESDTLDFDESAGHDNFPLRFEHPRDLLEARK